MPTILPDLPKVEAAIVEITNTVRAEAKLGAVVVSPQLTAAARAYADLLAKTGKFSHEADGTLSDRAQRAGYEHCTIAENLAMPSGQPGLCYPCARGFRHGGVAQLAGASQECDDRRSDRDRRRGCQGR